MNKMNIPFFGELDINSPEDYYETEIDFQNKKVDIDLNFDDALPEKKWFEDYINYANRLSDLYNYIKNEIKKYCPEDGIVKEYVDYHLQELPEEIEELLKTTDSSLPYEDKILSLIKLDRIGFYVDNKSYAIWDFSFGRDITDEILVIITNHKGDIEDITWES
jgi:hypothetical protein